MSTARGRGKEGLSEEQLEKLNEAIELLEADGGLKDATVQPELDGKWKLLYTSRPGSASPIQRTFTGVESFSVFQEVTLQTDEPRVNNIVDFGPKVGYLKVRHGLRTLGTSCNTLMDHMQASFRTSCFLGTPMLHGVHGVHPVIHGMYR